MTGFGSRPLVEKSSIAKQYREDGDTASNVANAICALGVDAIDDVEAMVTGQETLI